MGIEVLKLEDKHVDMLEGILRPECQRDLTFVPDPAQQDLTFRIRIGQVTLAWGGWAYMEKLPGEYVGWSLTTVYASRYAKFVVDGYTAAHAIALRDHAEVTAYNVADFSKANKLLLALGYELRTNDDGCCLWKTPTGIMERYSLRRGDLRWESKLPSFLG